jgi:capsular polysaccharide biosynthesis protein
MTWEQPQPVDSMVGELRRAGRLDDAIALLEIADRERPGTMAAVHLAALLAEKGDLVRARERLVAGLAAVENADDVNVVEVANLVMVLRRERVVHAKDRELAAGVAKLEPDRRLIWLLSPQAGTASPHPLVESRMLMARRRPSPALASFFDDFPQTHGARFAAKFASDDDIVLHHVRDSFLYVFRRGFFVLGPDFVDTGLTFPYALDVHLQRLKSEPVKSTFGEAFFVGDHLPASNYCQWLTDYLPRIVIADGVGGKMPILIPRFQRLGFQSETLALLGIPEDKLIALEPGLHRVESLFMLNTSSHAFRRYYQYGHSDYAALVLDRIPDSGARRESKLWLGRGNARRRRIINQEEVEQIYTEYGYQGVDPGSMSFAEQVRLMQGATHVAGPHGAALTNVVFCAPGTSVTEVFPADYGTGAFAVLSAMRSLDYQPLVGSRLGSGSIMANERQNADVSIDLDLLRAALERRGGPLVSGRRELMAPPAEDRTSPDPVVGEPRGRSIARLLRTGEVARAVEEAESALQSLHGDLGLLASVVDAFRGAGRLAEASALLDDSDREHPGRMFAIHSAILHAQGGDLARARERLIAGLDAVTNADYIDVVAVANLVMALRRGGVVDDADSVLARGLTRLNPHADLSALVLAHTPALPPARPSETRVLMKRQPPSPMLVSYFKDFRRHPATQASKFVSDQDVILHRVRDAFLFAFDQGFFVLDADFNSTELTFPYVLAHHLDWLRNEPVRSTFTDAFFAGDRFNARNYCHWIADYLPRIMLGREVGSDLPILVPRLERDGFQGESLELLGVPRGSVIAIEPGLHRVENLFLLNTSSHAMRRYFQHGHTEYAASVLDRVPRFGSTDGARWWIDRGNTPRRRIANREEVEKVYSRHGYRSVDLGSLPMADQIRLMQSATHVAGLHGAALTNVVFCRPGTAVLELFPSDYGTGAFATLSALRSLRYVPWLGASSSAAGVLHLDRQEADVTIDLERLERGLQRLD